MKAMRARRRADGLREVRLIVPDVHSESFRRRIAAQAAALDPKVEDEALDFIEAAACPEARADRPDNRRSFIRGNGEIE